MRRPDLRSLLRDKDIRHGGIRRDGDSLVVRFRDEATRKAATGIVSDNLADMNWQPGTDASSALLGLADTPQIQCLLLDSERAPCGVGDIALPPLAPALAAAIHALTGQRLRRLPLRPA